MFTNKIVVPNTSILCFFVFIFLNPFFIFIYTLGTRSIASFIIFCPNFEFTTPLVRSKAKEGRTLDGRRPLPAYCFVFLCLVACFVFLSLLGRIFLM